MNSSKQKAFDFYWLICQITLFIFFLCLDFLPVEAINLSNILKFSTVIICFLYSLLRSDDRLLHLSYVFTLIADLLIIFIKKYNFIAISTFCFTHIVNSVRFRPDSIKKTLTLFVIVIYIALFLLSIIPYALQIVVPAFVYAVCLITATYCAWSRYKKNSSPPAKKNFYGMLFFVLCDICVLIYNLHIVTKIPKLLNTLAENSIWLFYFPAQCMLSHGGMVHE